MRRLRMLAVLAAALPVLGQPAWAAEFKDLISGSAFPLTMRLKDFSGEWLRVSVGGAAETSGPFQMYAAMFGGGPSGIYYTRGETAAVGSETFIIAYKAQVATPNFAAIMMGEGEAPAPEPMTPETTLGLALLNLRGITSLEGIRPFNLEQEIAESKATAEQAAAMAEQMEGATEESNTDSSEGRLRQLALAALMYASDWEDTLPPTQEAALREALLPYVADEEIFLEPETDKPFRANLALAHAKIEQIENPENTILFYEADAAPDGSRWVAFVDGHVSRVEAAQWERLKKASNIP